MTTLEIINYFPKYEDSILHAEGIVKSNYMRDLEKQILSVIIEDKVVKFVFDSDGLNCSVNDFVPIKND